MAIKEKDVEKRRLETGGEGTWKKRWDYEEEAEVLVQKEGHKGVEETIE